MANDSQPITGLCVIADKERCPVHFEVIENTTDNQDADMWKDGFFRKVTRYLCFTRQPSQGNVVLTDLTVVKDNEPIPQGYTSIGTTSDTKEPILKKKLLIAQFVMRGTVSKAISDIHLTSAKSKTRPVDATPRGEINGLYLYLRMGSLTSAEPQPAETDPYGRPMQPPNPQPYANNTAGYYGAPTQAPNPAVQGQPLPYQYPSRGGTLARQASMIQTNAATERIQSAIEGVPFELHASLQPTNQSDLSTLRLPTDQDMFFRYNYDFSTEQQCKRSTTMP